MYSHLDILRYNNSTYRIDEIAWDKHPSGEFEGRKNREDLVPPVLRWQVQQGHPGPQAAPHRQHEQGIHLLLYLRHYIAIPIRRSSLDKYW